MSVFSSAPRQQVVDYALSIHYGVCLAADKLLDVKIGEKSIGLTGYENNTVVEIDREGLFGGPKKGGGVKGKIWLLFGSNDQEMPEELAQKHGRTPGTMPGYRGLFSAFFTATSDLTGFVWGSNNPVVPQIEFVVQRAPKGLHDLDEPMIGPDANPAHILYELLSDPAVGAGYGRDQIDVDSFVACAETLREEGMGLSFVWIESTPVETFCNEILQHINANMSFNLANGMWGLKLLRGDYVSNRLPEINEANSVVTSFQRKGWGDTVSEMSVTWLNPANEKEETVKTFNDAATHIQGVVRVADSSKNYPGIRSTGLALRVCERDLRQASAPLANAEIILDRSFYNVKEGDVFSFNHPEHVDHPIVIRVTLVEYSSKGPGGVKISAIEDIFSFGSSLTEAQGSNSENIDQPPENVRYAFVGDAVFYLLATVYGDAEARAMTFPEGRTMLLADTSLNDLREIDVLGLDAGVYADCASIGNSKRATLAEALPVAKESSLTVPASIRSRVRVGDFVILSSPTNDNDNEFCVVRSIATESIALARGMLDTVPRNWPIDTVVWFTSKDTVGVDPTERAAGDSATYKFLPITSLGRLPEAEAVPFVGTLSDRPYRPSRPTNVRLNNQEIPEASIALSAGTITVSWSNRNRLTETAILRYWDEANAAPEVGQTTTIRFRRSGVVEHEVTGSTATTLDVIMADIDAGVGDEYVVQLIAVRDGFESAQTTEIRLKIT